jgi:hypothetical protein
VAQLYLRALGSLYVASYDSQGYGGRYSIPPPQGIRHLNCRLHHKTTVLRSSTQCTSALLGIQVIYPLWLFETINQGLPISILESFFFIILFRLRRVTHCFRKSSARKSSTDYISVFWLRCVWQSSSLWSASVQRAPAAPFW